MSTFETLKQELTSYAFPAGISTSVLLEVSPPLRRVLQKIMRQGSMTFKMLSEELDLTGHEAAEIADLFVKCGFLKSTETTTDGDVVYRICHTRSHRPDAPIAIWRQMLDDMRDDLDPRGSDPNGNSDANSNKASSSKTGGNKTGGNKTDLGDNNLNDGSSADTGV
ncbi:MAG: hypothetical protein AAF708_11440 [Deinococcota bacterium]